jgi:hypothetical protein
MSMELTLRIIAEDLAAIDFGAYSSQEDQSGIFLGIQKDQEVVDTVPVAAGTATFTALLRVSPLSGGGTNCLGPYAHGTREARFCYLSWLSEGGMSHVSSFGRVKVHLSSLRWEKVEAAVQAEKTIVMRFSLLGKGGKPVFASVPSDAIQWEF